MPNPFPNIPANLFPEHARKLSLNSAVAVSTAAALASAASGSAAGGSGKAPRLSIAEGRDENNSPTPAAEVATHTAGVAVPIVPGNDVLRLSALSEREWQFQSHRVKFIHPPSARTNHAFLCRQRRWTPVKQPLLQVHPLAPPQAPAPLRAITVCLTSAH